MKNTFQLSIIIVYLSFIPISDCSTGNIMTDELAGTPPKPAHTQTQLPPPENIQTNNATVIKEVVEVRDSFASGTTDKDTAILNSLRSGLKSSSGKTPVSSLESVTSNPYTNILKKTSGFAITSSDSRGIESDSTHASLSSRKPASAPPKKTGEIQVNVPEADFSYVGIARIVKNKK